MQSKTVVHCRFSETPLMQQENKHQAPHSPKSQYPHNQAEETEVLQSLEIPRAFGRFNTTNLEVKSQEMLRVTVSLPL